MIKAVTGTIAQPIVLLGLSGENITRLYADEPILVKLKDLHINLPDVTIVLIADSTEAALKARLEQSIPGFDKT